MWPPTRTKDGRTLARASGALSHDAPRLRHPPLRGRPRDRDPADRRAGSAANALFAGAHREEQGWMVPSHTEVILRAHRDPRAGPHATRLARCPPLHCPSPSCILMKAAWATAGTGATPGGAGGLIEARAGGRDPAPRLLHSRARHHQQPHGARRGHRRAAAARRQGQAAAGAAGLRLGIPGQGHAGMGARLDRPRLEAEGRRDREPGAVAGAGGFGPEPRGPVDLGSRATRVMPRTSTPTISR